LSPLFCYDLRN